MKTIEHRRTDGGLSQWSGKQVGVTKIDNDGTMRHYKNDGGMSDGITGGKLIGVSKPIGDKLFHIKYKDGGGFGDRGKLVGVSKIDTPESQSQTGSSGGGGGFSLSNDKIGWLLLVVVIALIIFLIACVFALVRKIIEPIMTPFRPYIIVACFVALVFFVVPAMIKVIRSNRSSSLAKAVCIFFLLKITFVLLVLVAWRIGIFSVLLKK